MSFSEDAVAEIRSRADIVSIIGETVALKRSGRNYAGLCPFHQERSPSFNVNPERQIFRCFGCGEGGDVFSFMMKAHHLSFPEALEQLAERYGVALPQRRPEDDDRSRMREANDHAASFYQKMLEHPEFGEKARQYLADRGIDAAMQKKFGLGYAPAQWDGLHRYLNGLHIAGAVQEKAALVRTRGNNGGFYDYFRNRLMFPIHNEAGHAVGFGARAIDPEDEPKYLNSPETLLYRKGNLLYGLNQAREAIKARDQALLMEGYMDVITAHSNGFEHAVGVLGTALTPSQSRVLLRYTPGKRIVIAFDADKAGQAAAEKGLATLAEVTQGTGLDARVLAVPEGKDPDAYLRKEGPEAFGRLLEQAPSLYAFLLDRAIAPFDLATPEGRSRAIVAAVPVLRSIGNYVTQDHYVTRLSERLEVREDGIRLEISRGLGHNVAPSRGTPPPKERPREKLGVKGLSSREAERILLYFMVEQTSIRELVTEQLVTYSFEPLNQVIRERIALAGDTPLSWAQLLDHFAGETDVQQAVSAMMFEDYDRWKAEPTRIVEDCINTLEASYWEGELAKLKERLKQEGAAMDPQTHDAIVSRLQELNAYCVQLKHKRSNLVIPGKPASDDA